MACHVQAGDSLEWFMGGLTTGQSAGGSSLHLRCYFGYFGHFGNTLGTLAAWVSLEFWGRFGLVLE